MFGRAEEVAALVALIADALTATVAFVHGPGGIGKSTLVRAVAERLEERGVPVASIDGRDEDRVVASLDAAMIAVSQDPATVLVLDAYERVAALGGRLRAELGAGVPLRALLAGRVEPEPAWRDASCAGALHEFALGPLSASAAIALVRERGVDDAVAIDRIVRWAVGSPLALTVAADAVHGGQHPDFGAVQADALLGTAITNGAVGTRLLGADREIIAVAATARAVDARLLGAVLPGIDGDQAEAWLRGLSVAEPLGTRVTLHERVRVAVRDELREQDAEYERALRRRVTEHLYARATLGEKWLFGDLAELIDDPLARWGIAPPPARSHRVERATPSDAEAVRRLYAPAAPEWWPGVARWFSESAEHVMIIKDPDGSIGCFGVAVTPATAPAWAADDPVVGPWLAHAVEHVPDGDVVIGRDTGQFNTDPTARATAVGVANQATILTCGAPTCRHWYAPLDPDIPEYLTQREFFVGVGYRHLQDLDVVDHDRRLECWYNDCGPGGVFALIRNLIYRDLAMHPPPLPEQPAELQLSVVRDALRAFHDPVALAASPLARGGPLPERAASVRRMLEQATVAAFGASDDERLQQAVLRSGYMDRGGGHARAAHELNLSRTTYFRRLADAATRVADYVVAAHVDQR